MVSKSADGNGSWTLAVGTITLILTKLRALPTVT